MKTIKTLTFVATAFLLSLFLQAPTVQAAGKPHVVINFTKWVTSGPFMAGFSDVGDFKGEVLNFAEDSAETSMIKRQSHHRVREMLERLPEDQREVIILRHYADMSFKEIAATTNCSINTALGRMRYGLINLRKLMVQKQIAL